MKNKKPKATFRADLLRDAKTAKGESLKTIYEQTGVAIATQRRALAGRSILDVNLKRFADYLGVDWLELHDVDGVLTQTK